MVCLIFYPSIMTFTFILKYIGKIAPKNIMLVCGMSYYLEHEGSEHLRVLQSTLLAWAKEDQDIYLVSQVGAQKQKQTQTNK